MAIEFPCPHCDQFLRVGDETAGKTAKCPRCNGLAKIPGGNSERVETTVLPSLFGEAPSQGNPFSDGGDSRPPESKPVASEQDLNPYSSPQAAYQAPSQLPPVVPQAVGIEAILDYSWQLWRQHLVLLTGVTLALFVIPGIIALILFVPQVILAQNGEQRAAYLVWLAAQFLSNLMQLFLSIGEKQIVLKVARGQTAKFSELFGGANLFLPVLGASLLFSLALLLGLAAAIAPGFIVILVWWSSFTFVVDRKSGILESFAQAARISRNNWWTTFVMILISVGIFAIGCFVFCIGILPAAPLISMLWSVAYLMMSGQLSVDGKPVPPKM